MVEEVVYLGFHQDVRVRLATGALVRGDVPNDGDGGRARRRATRSPCTCRPTTCACSEAPAASEQRREELRRRAHPRASIGRTGFAARRRSGEITREAGARLGLLNYHFGSKDEVVAEAFAAAAREDLADAGGDLAAPRGPGRPAGRLPRPVRVGRPRRAGALWVDAWGESVHSPRVRDTLGRFDVGWRAVLAEVLADGVRQGAGRAPIPQDTAARLVAVLDGIGLHTTVHGEDVAARARGRVGAPAGRARARRDAARGPAAAVPGARRRRRTRRGSRSARATSTRTGTSIPPCCSRSSRRRATAWLGERVPDAAVAHVAVDFRRPLGRATAGRRCTARSTPSAARASARARRSDRGRRRRERRDDAGGRPAARLTAPSRALAR